MDVNDESVKTRVWYVVKVLLWYFFYQIACTCGLNLLNWAVCRVTGEALFFTDNFMLSAALFLSALLMLWHLFAFGYVKVTSRSFAELSLSLLAKTTLLIFGSMYLFNVLMEWLPLPDLMEQTFMAMTDEPLGVLSMALLAPLVEELMFRGAIQGYLLHRCSRPWVAIVVSALVFGIIHMNPQQVVYATSLGIVFGWIYYRTRSLLPVIVGHVLNNSVAVVAMWLWGTEDMEVIASDDKLLMIPSLLLLVALLVPLALNINRSLPPVPSPWCGRDE